ncbi:MAG: hypothetical protein H0X17_02745 [Deltaproteobacteria bacterium]|nr:hypothetical protein [Deltaproteobacteria bacterium]
MRVTFVKKLKLDGTACRKCVEVEQRLQEANLMARIDEVVIADERDATSAGMLLAAELGVDAAPFFIVTANGTRTVYTSYVKILKEVLSAPATDEDEAKEILERSDLDFL